MIERRCDPACLLSAVCAEHAALEQPLADRARCLANRSKSIPDQSLTVRSVEFVSLSSSSPSPPPNGSSAPIAIGSETGIELRQEDRDVSDRRRRPRRVPGCGAPGLGHQHATFCGPQFELSASGIGPDSSYRGRCEKQRNRLRVGYVVGGSPNEKRSDAATRDEACNRGSTRAAEPAVARISLRKERMNGR